MTDQVGRIYRRIVMPVPVGTVYAGQSKIAEFMRHADFVIDSGWSVVKDKDNGHYPRRATVEEIASARRLTMEELELVSPRNPSAVDMIAAERRRQVVAEGYDAEHDKRHDEGELAQAAVAYALPGNGPVVKVSMWPFERGSFKETDGSVEERIRELVKAGALIAAEIDRLLAWWMEDHGA